MYEARSKEQTIFRAASRGFFDYGGVQSYHSFPFGDFEEAQLDSFGALCVLNDDVLPPGGGVGAHPHQNREMVWLVLEGELTHRDDLGNFATLRAGDVQLLSAGSGVWHAEKNESQNDVRALQIWLMPDEFDSAPRYEKRALPTHFIGWQTIAAPIEEQNDNTLGWRQKAWLSRAKMSAGQAINYQTRRAGNGLYLFVLEGQIAVDDEILHHRDAMGLLAEKLTVQAHHDCDILLFDVPGVKM